MRQEGQRDRHEFDLDVRADRIPTHNWSDSSKQESRVLEIYVKIVNTVAKTAEISDAIKCSFVFFRSGIEIAKEVLWKLSLATFPPWEDLHLILGKR